MPELIAKRIMFKLVIDIASETFCHSVMFKMFTAITFLQIIDQCFQRKNIRKQLFRLSQTVPCKTQIAKYPFGNTTCVLQWAGGHSSNGIPMLYSWDSGVENEAAIKVSEVRIDLVIWK